MTEGVDAGGIDASALKQVGLTEGEARVYLALVRLGSATTGPVSDESGVSRSKIYGVLERLMRKGLASFIVKEKTRYYQAAEPFKLQDYLEARENEFKRQRRQLDELIPKLAAQKASAKQSEAQIFKGFKGMQAVNEHVFVRLKRGETADYMLGAAYQDEKYHRYWHKWHKTRVKAGIKNRLLFSSRTDASILANRNAYAGCDARYMPLPVDVPAWVMVYSDVTVIGLQSDELAIEIVNDKIAESFREYFEALWKLSKPFRNHSKVKK